MLNPGRHYDIGPNEDLVAVIVSDKALEHAFRRTVQHSPPGSENRARCNEMLVIPQTVLKGVDDGVVEVAT